MGAVPRRTAGFVTTSLVGRRKNELFEGPWSPEVSAVSGKGLVVD